MNNIITYEELLKLSMNKFNARKNKTVQELLLYLYQYNRKPKLMDYNMYFEEISDACINLDSFKIRILDAISELIANATSKENENKLLNFHKEFMYNSLKVDNPLRHLNDSDDFIYAYLAILNFYFDTFKKLEGWGYYLGKLYVPSEV